MRKQAARLYLELFLLIVLPLNTFAQSAGSASSTSGEDPAWIFIVGVVLILGLAGLVAWRINSKGVPWLSSENMGDQEKSQNRDFEGVERRSAAGSDRRKRDRRGGLPAGFPQTSNVLNQGAGASEGIDFDEVKEKIEQMRFERLPINRFESLRSVKPFDALELANDDALLSAVDQAYDESEEDEEVRLVALKILSKFRYRNSVEALSQMALYDLSANIRSKAVGSLADFDHESVFDTLLLACADPSREVRAAGAKALFKVSFNRADAWVRLADCGDKYRIIQAARAAIEADLVDRSIDRLIHKDEKMAYEALTLLNLLIRADETEPVFNALRNHKDKNVRLAILQVFKIVNEDSVAPQLAEIVGDGELPVEVATAAKDIVDQFEPAIAS